jgi:hypothetical protein
MNVDLTFSLDKKSHALKTSYSSGYVGGGYGRSLGVRRTGGRQPLHDPDAEGALVLFTPRELTEHERLKVEGGLSTLVHCH